jgi:hypothetical protein
LLGGAENRFGDNVDGGLIVGGFHNDILGSLSSSRRQIAPVIVGGSDNEIGESSSWAAIVGGDGNRIGTNSYFALIVGGGGSFSPYFPNRIRDNSAAATVVGGTRNVVSYDSPYSFVGGGYHNEIQTNAAYATLAGGYYNEVLEGAEYAIIPGGLGIKPPAMRLPPATVPKRPTRARLSGRIPRTRTSRPPPPIR